MQKNKLNRLAVTSAALLFVGMADNVQAIPIKVLATPSKTESSSIVGLVPPSSLAALKKMVANSNQKSSGLNQKASGSNNKGSSSNNKGSGSNKKGSGTNKKGSGSAVLVTAGRPITPVTVLAITPISGMGNLPGSGRTTITGPTVVPVGRPQALVDGNVPDGGATLVMLGSAFSGIVLLRRKLVPGAKA